MKTAEAQAPAVDAVIFKKEKKKALTNQADSTKIFVLDDFAGVYLFFAF